MRDEADSDPLIGLGPPGRRPRAARVDGALTAPVRFEGGSTTVGTAIGIATFPEHGADARAVLAHADREMYAAKAR